jgi:hypothetical protein
MKERWSKLSWKQKQWLMIAVWVVSALIIYNNALTLTLNLKEECTQLNNRIDSAELIKSEIAELERELIRSQKFTDSSSFLSHEHLLDLVSNYCSAHSLTVQDFPSALQFKRNEWNVEVHEITVTGTYAQIVQLLEYVYQNEQGRIVSVSFFSKTDNKTKVKSLLATIYVQTLFNTST